MYTTNLVSENHQCYQEDTYQCGVWDFLAIKSFLKYLEQEENKEFSLESFEEADVLENMSDRRNDKYIRDQWEYLKEKLKAACMEDLLSFKSPKSRDIIESIDEVISISQTDLDDDESSEGTENSSEINENSEILSFIFLSDVIFQTASIDARYTLWEVPDASNGKEYISFLGRKHWEYYFKTLNVSTVYWNYDLYSVIKQQIPKHQERE